MAQPGQPKLHAASKTTIQYTYAIANFLVNAYSALHLIPIYCEAIVGQRINHLRSLYIEGEAALAVKVLENGSLCQLKCGRFRKQEAKPDD
jgi:hypothetical protein